VPGLYPPLRAVGAAQVLAELAFAASGAGR